MRARALAVTGVAIGALVVSGCGSSGNQPASHEETATSASPGEAVTGQITVLAAASLTGTFDELGKQFKSAHPGVKVTFSFGGSSTLAQQITQGAPADVFASANTSTMSQVVGAGDAVGEPTVFVRNVLEIAVPKGNPAGVAGLADLAKQGVKVALCAKEVPCGSAAQELFSKAGITPHVSTYEEDVKAVLTKVELGEVDAGLVYRTDVKAAGEKVEGIDFPEADTVVNSYPIVALKAAPNPAAARAFVEYVLSDAGQAVMGAAGFTSP